MKIICSVIVVLLLSSGAHAQSVSKEDFPSLSWLEGKWTRLNMKIPGRTATEQWKKVSDHEFIGMGITLQGNDTVFVEKLKIMVDGNEIHYVADIPENPEPVHFMCSLPSHPVISRAKIQNMITLKKFLISQKETH